MDLSALSIQQLRYIDAVASAESFTGAADQLFVSQSALSQGLGRLEEIAGVALFESAGRRRVLTAAGRRVAESARRVIADVRRLGADLDAWRHGEGGTLRVAMIDAAALYLFDDRMASFRAEAPNVDVRITVNGSDECLARLASFDDDLALVVGPCPGFDESLMTSEPMWLFGPTADPPIGAEWAMYPAPSHTRAMIDEGLRRLGHRPQVIAESGNPQVLRQLALLNGAWTVLPARFGHDTTLEQGVQVTSRPIVAARRATSPVMPLVEAFVGHLT